MGETAPVRRHGRLGLIGWPFAEDLAWPPRWRDVFLPELKVEEYADGDQFVVKVEIPGIDPDRDVEVSVTGGVLLITAQRRSEKRDEKDGGFRTEFSYGAFERRIVLPEGSAPDDVKATYADGILEIRMPLRIAEQATAQIPVTRL